MSQLYSDRIQGPRPRTAEEINASVEKALQSLVQSYQDRDYFGIDFPETCPDNGRAFGTNGENLEAARVGMVPEIEDWGQKIRINASGQSTVPTMAILDTLEWHAKHVGEPHDQDFHDFYKHYHKKWDREAGFMAFREEVNSILARNGVAYEMGSNALITRLVEGPVAVQLRNAVFNSGDAETDRLLEISRTRFFDRDPDASQRSIEALWDAFERLKTHLDPQSKRNSAEALINATTQSAPEKDLIEEEMRSLTKIGNDWRIRHHEVDKLELGADRRLRDYLFLRMFALLHRIVPERQVTAKQEAAVIPPSN